MVPLKGSGHRDVKTEHCAHVRFSDLNDHEKGLYSTAANSEPTEVQATLLHQKGQKSSKKPWILASLILLATVLFAVLEAQLTSIGFKLSANVSINATTKNEARFNAPHFYTLCRFIARTLAFPLLFLGKWLTSTATGHPFSPADFLRHCSRISPPKSKGQSAIGALGVFIIPTICSMGFSAGMIISLVYIAPSIESACFSSVVAMSYILSIVFLKHPLLLIKTFFVACSFAGVALVAYETTQDPLDDKAYIGIVAILFSASSLALHQLSYTKSFPFGDWQQSAFRVTIMFLVSTLLYWPIPLTAKMLGWEVWNWDDIPWGYLLGGVFSALCTGFLYAYGLALSSPFFMSLGELLNLTLSGLIDHFARGIHIGPFQIVGFVVIGVAFIVLILPDKYVTIERLKKKTMTFCTVCKR